MIIFVRKTDRVLEREWTNDKMREKNINELKEIGTQW
jgi:hypothetical protein